LWYAPGYSKSFVNTLSADMLAELLYCMTFKKCCTILIGNDRFEFSDKLPHVFHQHSIGIAPQYHAVKIHKAFYDRIYHVKNYYNNRTAAYSDDVVFNKRSKIKNHMFFPQLFITAYFIHRANNL
jgi:hypothetical protein